MSTILRKFYYSLAAIRDLIQIRRLLINENLITLLFTDKGIFTPAAVSDELIQSQSLL